MNIWTGYRTRSRDFLLHSNYNAGSIKDFVYCGVEKIENIPVFIQMKEPAFWEYDTRSKKEWKRIGETKDQDCNISTKSSQTRISKSKNAVNTIQQTKTVGQQQMISAKQVQKELRRGNEVYFALVLPKSVPAQGMMQQRKWEQMKLQGPVRKALPITETRKKFCSEVPTHIQK